MALPDISIVLPMGYALLSLLYIPLSHFIFATNTEDRCQREVQGLAESHSLEWMGPSWPTWMTCCSGYFQLPFRAPVSVHVIPGYHFVLTTFNLMLFPWGFFNLAILEDSPQPMTCMLCYCNFKFHLFWTLSKLVNLSEPEGRERNQAWSCVPDLLGLLSGSRATGEWACMLHAATWMC